MERVYLLTGKPGCGKTSLIKQAIAGPGIKAGGFYTEEMRCRGARTGFRLVTLDGAEAVLASVEIRGSHRVGRYGVDVAGLESTGVPALYRAAEEGKLVVIDEIGKMELLSPQFYQAVKKIIDSGAPVLGTIMLGSDPQADAIKRDARVKLVTLTPGSRPQVLEEVRRWLESLRR